MPPKTAYKQSLPRRPPSEHRHGHRETYQLQSAGNYHGRLPRWIMAQPSGVANQNMQNDPAWMRMTTWENAGINAD